MAADAVIQGDPNGGPFVITGTGFGVMKGSVTVGGQAAKITSWADGRIKGEIPAGAKGTIVLTSSSGSRPVTWPVKK